MPDLKNKHYVLGLTGGIACYKSAELLRRLRDHGAIVDVVMTPSAQQFITPLTFQALSGRPVHHELFGLQSDNGMAHINLARQADAIIVAPASTNFMARLANGLADDLLSTLCVARGNCPLLIAPAMNREMWLNPATQRNVQQLLADGIQLLGPGTGEQACGETGDGRMLEPDQILAEIIAFHQPKVLAGKSVLITAGPTSEAIDPVRVISNRSSGKMGYAIARAAAEAGARVSLVSGPTALQPPYSVSCINVHTAAQMHAAVFEQLSTTDIFISVAAVADWHVKNPANQKVKKGGALSLASLELTPNPDILADVASQAGGPWCVGFAAETEHLHQHAAEKRLRKNIPLLVGNLAQDTLGADTAGLVLFDDAGSEPLPVLPKLQAARRLIQAIATRYTQALNT